MRNRASIFLVTATVLSMVLVACGAPNYGVVYRPTSYGVPGQSYLICNQPSQLTSPWTYDALASGSQSYTAAQYEALSGYGTTLPPLPSYLATAATNEQVATIYAPGQTINLSSYHHPGGPELFFLEGGAYTGLLAETIAGDQFIGGRAPGYLEPVINDNLNSGYGIDPTQSSYSYNGGSYTLASSAAVGATSITLSSTPTGAQWVDFADASGLHMYQVTSSSGPTLTLASGLVDAESAGTTAWTAYNTGFKGGIGYLTAAASQNATTVTVATSIPLVPYEDIVIGSNPYVVDAVAGTPTGYTLTLSEGLVGALPANAPIWYSEPSSTVSMEYLSIENDNTGSSSSVASFDGGMNSTVEHNSIRNGYDRGVTGNDSNGSAIYVDGYSTTEYNCMQNEGHSAFHQFGAGGLFAYNEVTGTPVYGDSSGDSGQKWWGTLNSDIVDNAFIDDGAHGGSPIWLDNGNTGTLISGNYFYGCGGPCLSNETGFNGDYTGNLFANSGWYAPFAGGSNNNDGAINLNLSGGWNIPGSNYNNEVLVQDNIFLNDWEGVTIWGEGDRSTMNVGETNPVPPWNNAQYASGGFPNGDNQFGGYHYLANQGGAAYGGVGVVYRAQSCSSASPCSTLAMASPPSVGDTVGLPLATTTTDTGLVGSITSINATTTGFPSAGTLWVSTNACAGYAYVSYTGNSGTAFTGVSLVYGCGNGNLTGSVQLAVPPTTTTSDTTAVGATTQLDVPSIAGFATSGDVQVATSAANSEGRYVGAILAYTGTSSSCSPGPACLTGVSLVRGTGNLINGGYVQQVLPYTVTAVSSASPAVITVTPPITTNLTQGENVFDNGTCYDYATAAATPTGPIAPDGYSYLDGCIWQERNIQVTGNVFNWSPAAIAAGPNIYGNTGYQSCDSAHANFCGEMYQAFDIAGGAPFDSAIFANAMASHAGFTAPITGAWNGVPSNNAGEGAWGITWDHNVYSGAWQWNTYSAGTCLAPSGYTCTPDLAQWQSQWGQDAGSVTR